MPISIFTSKIIFMKYLPPVGPQIKSAQNLLKFSTCDISNVTHSDFDVENFFMKYLPIVRPKLVTKLKVAGIY